MVRAEKPSYLHLSPAELLCRTLQNVPSATKKCRLVELTEKCENKLSLRDVRIAMFAGGKRDHQASNSRQQHADAN
jgi:hypothetical protein